MCQELRWSSIHTCTCWTGEKIYFHSHFLILDLKLADFFSSCIIFILLVFELQTESGFITHILSRNLTPHPSFHAIFFSLLHVDQLSNEVPSYVLVILRPEFSCLEADTGIDSSIPCCYTAWWLLGACCTISHLDLLLAIAIAWFWS